MSKNLIDRLRAESMLFASGNLYELAADRVAELERELSALKAQPGGVVLLPEPDIRTARGYPAYSVALVAELFARLNHQPASGGESLPNSEQFCYCNDSVSLQIVSGGAHPLGYLGEVTLKINGEYVNYRRSEKQAVSGVVDEGAAGWTTQKPSEPGAYWIRGFRLFEKDSAPALVEVADDDGELVCNLHESNSQDSLRMWSPVSDFNDEFEWLGPLQARAALAQSERVPEGWREFIENCAGTAGGMVNGNRLSARASELLAAAPSPSKQGGV